MRCITIPLPTTTYSALSAEPDGDASLAAPGKSYVVPYCRGESAVNDTCRNGEDKPDNGDGTVLSERIRSGLLSQTFLLLGDGVSGARRLVVGDGDGGTCAVRNSDAVGMESAGESHVLCTKSVSAANRTWRCRIW